MKESNCSKSELFNCYCEHLPVATVFSSYAGKYSIGNNELEKLVSLIKRVIRCMEG